MTLVCKVLREYMFWLCIASSVACQPPSAAQPAPSQARVAERKDAHPASTPEPRKADEAEATAPLSVMPRNQRPHDGAYVWISAMQDRVKRGASNIEVKETRRGLSFKALGKDAHVPALLELGGAGTRFVPDGWPSGDIKIGIDKDLKKTTFAGLTFRRPTTIQIGEQGVVMAKEEGVTVSDQEGKSWVSKSVDAGIWRPLYLAGP